MAASAAAAHRASAAGRAPQKPAAAAATGGKPGGKLPRDMQVHFVLKLLTLKGEESATQIRQRMKDGRGVTVKGLHFEPSVLSEALQKWSKTRSGDADAPAGAPKALRPTMQSETLPDGGPKSPPGAATVLPTAKRRLSGSGSGGGATPPQMRKRSFSSVADENVDPQAMSAISRAAKEKAERRAASLEGAASLRRTPSGQDSPVPDLGPSASARQVPRPAGPPAGSAGASAGGPPPCPAAASKPPAKRLRRVASDPPAPAPAPARSPKARARPQAAAASADSGASKTVKELKLLLSECGLDFAGCVEKADLQALWERFLHFRSMPLEELRAACAECGGPYSASPDECARYLAAPPKAGGGGQSSAAPAPAAAAHTAHVAEPHTDDLAAEAAIRERDAEKEVQRIQALRKERFSTKVAWGFAVLDVTARDVAAVQRGYRNLMRKLHPDKVGRSAEVTRAVELIREAKELCERGLSKQEPPSAPRCLKSSTVCSLAGQRKFRLQWVAPDDRPTAPVRRYIVAAVDPAYGRALTITVLEPDYSEELRRFVGVEELTSYIFAEEDLQKMPRLWQQSFASVQVAAANEAGQSSWATLQLRLVEPSSVSPQDWASVCRGPAVGAGPPSSWAPPSGARGDSTDDPEAFDRELRRRRGVELHHWLERQRKPQLATWLRSNAWPSLGNKDELIDRIEQAMAPKTTTRRGGIGKL